MNKYVRKLFGVLFQSQQAQQITHIQPQPAPRSPEEWRTHWQARGFPWRTEAEIDVKRQEELSKYRAIVPDVEKGIYPFKGMKLSRADVEWLLATRGNEHELPDFRNDPSVSIDLRGADLRQVDLHGLPLARLYGGLGWRQWNVATVEQRDMAGIHLEGAILREAHLEGALLRNAHLEGADLALAHLEGAYLRHAHLEGADLFRAHLEGAGLRETYLAGADLRLVYFDHVTSLNKTILADEKHGFVSLVDAHWGSANLSLIDWKSVKMLGEERKVKQSNTIGGKAKQPGELLKEYHEAVRANRQLAIVLQNQGLNEEAARFAYRAQILQRKIFWIQREGGQWFFSLLLALLAGYGYRMWRILAAYLIVVLTCALAYFVLGLYYPPHLSFLQAFLESITAFHGRVFLEVFTSDAPQIWVTAAEAVLGLLIEGVFIAMLTQRFFGK